MSTDSSFKPLPAADELELARLAVVARCTSRSVIFFDPELRIRWVNPSFQEQLGYTFDEVVGKKLTELLHGRDTSQVTVDFIRQQISEGRDFRTEMVKYTKSGAKRHFTVEAHPIPSADGVIREWVSIETDVTDRLSAQEEIDAYLIRLSLAKTVAGIGLWEYDQATQVLAWDDRMFEIYGIDGASFRGIYQNWRERLLPEDLAKAEADFGTALDGDGRYVSRFRIIQGVTGQTRHIESMAVKLQNDWGANTRFIGINIDVTERRLAEIALEESELRFRRIFDQSPVGAALVSLEFRYLRVNRALCEMTGYSEDELIGHTFSKITHPDDLSMDLMQGEMVLAAGTAGARTEKRYLRKDGRVVWVERVLQVVRDAAGQPLHYLPMSQDITKRREAESALRFSEARWQFALEGSGDGVWDWNLETDDAYFSRQWKAMIGFDEAELPNRIEEWRNRVHPMDMPVAEEALKRHFAGATSTYLCEHRLLCKDGSWKWILDRGRVVEWSEDGKPLRMIGTHTDLSARVAAEQALRASETRYRLVMENLSEGIVVQGHNGALLQCNPAAERILGLSLQQMVGRDSSDPRWQPRREDGSPFSVDELPAMVALRTGKPVGNTVMELQRGDGKRIWTLLSSVPLPSDSGDRAATVVSSFSDITEQKEAAQEIDRIREQLVSILGTIDDAVYSLSPDAKKILFISRAVERLSGLTPEQLHAKPSAWSELVVEEDREQAARVLLDVLTQGVASGEYRIRRTDGAIRWILDRCQMAVDKSGKPIRIDGVRSDITARKEAELARIDMERKLLHSQKLESLGVLAGGVAHDFNNLLMAIMGSLEMMQLATELPPEARHWTETALQATRTATQLTRQMLAYSGRGKFLTRALRLGEMATTNGEILRVAIPRNVTLAVEIDPDEAPILADEGQIQQVVMNLITNAAESIGSKAGSVRLLTGTRHFTSEQLAASPIDPKPPAGMFSYVEVTDNGSGMDAAVIARIFEPFFTTKFTGRGLGMAAVLGIVSGHQGAIFIQSQPGQGTTVCVAIPVVPVTDSAIGTATKPKSTEGDGREESATRGCVLIIEDEEIVRSAASAMLRASRYKVLTAADGTEGVRTYDAHRGEIDVVLLDLIMPGLDGISAFQAIREIKPSVPVVMMSGFTREEVTQRLGRDQPSGFLQKPFQLSDLRREIARLIGSR